MFDIFAILKKTKKLFTRNDVLIISGLLILFFVTRLIHLTQLPIFTDEGIYIHWAKVAWHDASWRFISLTDGRQPLQTWLTIPFLKLFPDNSLFAGRLFGVFSGLGSLIGLFSLLYYLFGKKAAYIGSLIYILNPYFLFYDRMALADSSVNAGFVWMLLLSILLVRKLQIDTALLFGFLSGFVLLSKSTPKLFLISSAFAPILVYEKKLKNFIKHKVNYLTLFVIGVGLATLIYNVQRLSPFFQYVSQKNTTFVLTFAELRQNPFALLPHNLLQIPLYVFGEAGWLLAIAGVLGVVMLWKKDWRLTSYLLLWIVIPYTAIALISRVLFPRYVIFLAMGTLIFVSYALSKLDKQKFLIAIIVLLVSFIFGTYTSLFDPKYLPFPEIDRGQYVEGITAGWGVSDIIDFARTKSLEKPVVLLGEGDFGVIGNMLDASLGRSDVTVSVKGYWPLGEKELVENQPLLKDHYVYIIFSHRQDFPTDWPMKFVGLYPKPGSKNPIHVFELLSE